MTTIDTAIDTAIDTPIPAPTSVGSVAPLEFGLVAEDLYKDIHKALRVELFSVVGEAGSLDPADREGRAALAAHTRDVIALLDSHAEHEDTAIQPTLESAQPRLAELIAADHEYLEGRLEDIAAMAEEAVDAPGPEQHARVHHLYLEWSSFTGAYLRHQDVEERVVMPALETSVGLDTVIGIHQAIVSSIPPEEMTRSLAVMLPALNVEDRVGLLGGMQAGAPPEVFAGVWSLARSVLTPADATAVARRLGLD